MGNCALMCRSASETAYYLKSKGFNGHFSEMKVNPDMVERQAKADLSLDAKDEIGKRREVKEDLVKTQKKGTFITEEAMNRNHKNSNLTPSPVSYPMRSIGVSPGKVHQVFFNFRGDQLRYNFVSHVRDAFQRHEIKFFIDEHELRGNDLKHLFVRIEESSIALAIFSTRYSESSFCMDELVKMKERADQGKLRVIPIFYKVKAEDVRKPTPDSEFGRNFWSLTETINDEDKIKAWMDALEFISEKTGLPLGEKSSESEFVNKIVMELKRIPNEA